MDRLRCDRKQPCGTCARRGLSHTCTYASSSSMTGQSSIQSQSQTQSKFVPNVPMETDLPDRVQQLERLVLSMVSNSNAASKASSVTDTAKLASENPVCPGSHIFDEQRDSADRTVKSGTGVGGPPSVSSGIVRRDNGSTIYVEATHWTAILEEVYPLPSPSHSSHET